ncbi:MAG: hypothetical protein JXR48_07790 [Candidatus Delongbacteria bacterium]|nr:hypothetical protein [Candidatus Delongbacteria bacterium]MBN2834853.1 hypothetical protein [Candidatus Delongbacteria bacterium]
MRYFLFFLLISIQFVFANNYDALIELGNKSFSQKKYRESYNLFIEAFYTNENREEALVGLYNSSIYTLENKMALKFANLLFEKFPTELNFQRILYANAINGNLSECLKLIKSKNLTFDKKKDIVFSTGSGFINNYYAFESAEWYGNYMEDMDDPIMRDLHKQQAKLVRDKPFREEIVYGNYWYKNDLFDNGYFLYLSSEIGDYKRKGKVNYNFQKSSSKGMKKIETEYDIRQYGATELNYKYNNKYYLETNDSLLLDTTEIYNLTVYDSLFTNKTLTEKIKIREQIQNDISFVFSEKFSSMYNIDLYVGYTNVTNGFIEEVFHGGVRNCFSFLNSSFFFDAGISSIKNMKIGKMTLIDSLIIKNQYTNTDTTISSGVITIMSLDTTSVYTLRTESEFEGFVLEFEKSLHGDFRAGFEFYVKEYTLSGSLTATRFLESDTYDNKIRYRFESGLYYAKNKNIFYINFSRGDSFLNHNSDYSYLNISDRFMEYNLSGGLVFSFDEHFDFFGKYSYSKFSDAELNSISTGLFIKF